MIVVALPPDEPLFSCQFYSKKHGEQFQYNKWGKKLKTFQNITNFSKSNTFNFDLSFFKMNTSDLSSQSQYKQTISPSKIQTKKIEIIFDSSFTIRDVKFIFSTLSIQENSKTSSKFDLTYKQRNADEHGSKIRVKKISVDRLNIGWHK